MSYHKPLISLSNISIQYRLPLIISVLLILVIIIFAGLAYFGLRESNLDLGYERLITISNQFVSSLETSNERNKIALFQQAQQQEIKNYLLKKGRQSAEKLTEVLNRHIIPTDSLLLNIQLLDKNYKPVFTSLKKTSITIESDSVLYHARQKPLYSAVGKLYTENDSIVWPVAAAVKEGNQIIGYVYKLRLLKISEQTLQAFANLLGANTSFHFANDDGSLWTDLKIVVPPLPLDINNKDIVEYTDSDGEEVIAKIADIKDVPWSISIARSKEVTLAPAKRFLEIISAIGLILLVTGVFLAWFMSRNITKPLNELALAASGISEGDYSALADFNRKDELGRLAVAFNKMVIKVRDSQEDLERKVKIRTVELRNANDELEELNRKLKELDELKTNFFTNVSHELRTPLALIMGPVEKLLSQKDFSNNSNKDLRIIQQNARILLKQVNNLLDLSKLEVGKMEIEYSEIDMAKLVKVIASYFESIALGKKIMLKVSVPETLFVQADSDKIERVLINLLSNAFKFTPDDGTINCKLTSENSKMIFRIEDSGPGIKPEFQEAIFARYKQSGKGLTRHLGSTGLGLSIVKEFIELHKGNIEVKNNEKGGAVFSFSIPLNAPEGSILSGKMIIKEEEVKDNIDSFEILRTENRGEKKILYELKTPRKAYPSKGLPMILVIEDNPDMNSFIAQTLNNKYIIISSYDGEDGYQKAAFYKPDLIITDIMMPRLSGDMMVNKIKSNPELDTIPIIILSAKSDEELKIDLLRQGVEDYLNKPFTIEELKARVNNLIKVKLIKDRLQNELKSHTEDISTLVEELSQRKNIIEISLQEKEVLLKEIHHRVKNNLQVISSLLNLQSNSIIDPETFEVFRESQNRIRSMALIHEKLYLSQNLMQINFEEYVNDIIANLFNSYNLSSDYLDMKIHINNIFFSIDTAINLGLIINELITNALKHAFKDGETNKGEIRIHMDNHEKNKYCLVVKDNGKGIPHSYDFKNPQTLGLRLVNSLVSQIEGDMKVYNSDGTEFKITFETHSIGY